MTAINEESTRPDIVLSIEDESTGKQYLCAAFVGPMECKGEPDIDLYDLLDRPLKVTRFTVVKR